MLCDVAMDTESAIHTRGVWTIRDGSRPRDFDVIHDPLFVMHYGSTLLPSDDRICAAYALMYRWRTTRLIPAFRWGILDGPGNASDGFWTTR